MMDCSKRKFKIPLKQQVLDLRNFSRIVRTIGMGPHRKHFWHVFKEVATKNPKALRYAVAMMALYVHFGPFSRYIVGRIDEQILRARVSKDESELKTAVKKSIPSKVSRPREAELSV